jgi:hypothetical protein
LKLLLLLLHLLLTLQVEANLLLLLLLHHQLLLQLKCKLLLLRHLILLLILLCYTHYQLLQECLLRSVQLMVLLRLQLCRLLRRWLLQTCLMQQLRKLRDTQQRGQDQKEVIMYAYSGTDSSSIRLSCEKLAQVSMENVWCLAHESFTA